MTSAAPPLHAHTVPDPVAALQQRWHAATRRRSLLQGTDRDMAQALVGRVFRPHRLEPARAGTGLNMEMQHLDTGLLGLVGLRYGTDVDITPGPLERFYLLQVPLHGRADIECGEHAFTSDTRCASLLSPAPDLRMHWTADNEQLCLRIDAETVERFMGAWTGQPVRRLPTFQPQVWLHQQPRLLDLLHQFVYLGEAGATLGAAQVLPLSAVQLEYQLLVALFTGQPHDGLEALQAHSPPVAPRSVRLIEDHVVAHCDQPLTPETLAQLAGVSVRSLFLGFHRYRGISPMRFLRQVRMQRVRQDLLAADAGTRVADIALKWGFTHQGRFSLAYQSCYGESPRDTLRTATQAHAVRSPSTRAG